MTRRLIIRTKCPICGEQVEAVPDAVLKREPHHNNAEMVVTRSGYKQYIHTSCWYGMIEEQKRKRIGNKQKKNRATRSKSNLEEAK